MANYVFTGKSAANTAKTHTIVATKIKKNLRVHTLTVSTSGGDIAADCTVAIHDNDVSIWEVELRDDKVFGAHIDFSSAPIPITSGSLKVVTDAAGANVVVTVSCTYERY